MLVAANKIDAVCDEEKLTEFIEFVENEKYVGFDLDLADAVIKQMGGKMEFKSMGFDALIPAIQSNQIDLIASGMDATP